MTLSKAQILALRDAATKGKWRCWVGDEYADQFGIQRGEYSGVDSIGCAPCEQDLNDAAFVSALPDIAQTAIDAITRCEELERERKGDWYKINSLTGYIEGLLQGKRFPELPDVLKEVNEFLEENKPL